MSHWRRPPGPPAVYKVIDGRYSVQEIPIDGPRRQEVLDNLREYYLADEPLAKCMNLKDNPDAVEDFELFWNYALDQGVSIGCYKLDSRGRISELVGVSVLYIIDRTTLEDLDRMKTKLKSPEIKKVKAVGERANHEVDVFKIYGVDAYLGSLSLSVSSAYRGQKLGYHLLSARDEVGKRYGLKVTCAVFTANQSQTQAARAGFEEKFSLEYEDYVDEEGELIFPGIDWRNFKVMAKRLQT